VLRSGPFPLRDCVRRRPQSGGSCRPIRRPPRGSRRTGAGGIALPSCAPRFLVAELCAENVTLSAVITLTGGAVVPFGNKQGIYSGGTTGYATAAVQMMLAPTSKGVGLPDDGFFPATATCRPFNCTFRTPRPPRALRRINCRRRPPRARRRSSFLSHRRAIPHSTSSWRPGTVRQASPSRSPMLAVRQAR